MEDTANQSSPTPPGPAPRNLSRWCLILLLATGLFIALPFSLPANDKEKSVPLDLPSGVTILADDEDEDLTESIIFIGNEYRGEAFVWVLDVSGSMAGNDRLGILRHEVETALQSLSRRSEFGLVAFASHVDAYHPSPQRATGANKESARAWLASLTPGGLTCMADGAVKALEVANRSTRPKVNVILISDGEPTCGDCGYTRSSIDIANFKLHPIHTVFVGGSGQGATCLQSLTANSGSYQQVGF